MAADLLCLLGPTWEDCALVVLFYVFKKTQHKIGNPYSFMRSLVTDDLKVVLAGNDLTGGVAAGGSAAAGGGSTTEGGGTVTEGGGTEDLPWDFIAMSVGRKAKSAAILTDNGTHRINNIAKYYANIFFTLPPRLRLSLHHMRGRWFVS